MQLLASFLVKYKHRIIFVCDANAVNDLKVILITGKKLFMARDSNAKLQIYDIEINN